MKEREGANKFPGCTQWRELPGRRGDAVAQWLIQLGSFQRGLKSGSSLPLSQDWSDLLQDGGVVAGPAATEAQGRTAEARENGADTFLRGE